MTHRIIAFTILGALFALPAFGAGDSDVSLAAGKNTYTVSSAPYNDEQQKSFDSLSPEEKERFQHERIWLLEKVVKFFNFNRIVMGGISVVKEKTVEVFTPHDLPDSILHLNDPVDHVPEAAQSPASVKFGHETVQSLVSAFDTALWNHSPVLSNADEFTVVATVGLAGGAMASTKGFYPGFNVGIVIGYNKTTESAVFELITDQELLNHAYPVVVQGGIVFKVMIQGRKRGAGDDNHPGEMFYPVGPFIEADRPDLFAIGVEQALSFPPLDTFYVYRSKFRRLTILSLNVGVGEGSHVVLRSSLAKLPHYVLESGKEICEALVDLVHPKEK